MSSLLLVGTCCPSAWLPVSVFSPAGWWVVGVEDELSSGKGWQGPWAGQGQELGINSTAQLGRHGSALHPPPHQLLLPGGSLPPLGA